MAFKKVTNEMLNSKPTLPTLKVAITDYSSDGVQRFSFNVNESLATVANIEDGGRVDLYFDEDNPRLIMVKPCEDGRIKVKKSGRQFTFSSKSWLRNYSDRKSRVVHFKIQDGFLVFELWVDQPVVESKK